MAGRPSRLAGRRGPYVPAGAAGARRCCQHPGGVPQRAVQAEAGNKKSTCLTGQERSASDAARGTPMLPIPPSQDCVVSKMCVYSANAILKNLSLHVYTRAHKRPCSRTRTRINPNDTGYTLPPLPLRRPSPALRPTGHLAVVAVTAVGASGPFRLPLLRPSAAGLRPVDLRTALRAAGVWPPPHNHAWHRLRDRLAEDALALPPRVEMWGCEEGLTPMAVPPMWSVS